MNTLDKAALGERIVGFGCPYCKDDNLRLGGFHIDGREKDLIVACYSCGWDGETNNSGVGLTETKEPDKRFTVWTYSDSNGKDFRSSESFFTLKQAKSHMFKLIQSSGRQNGVYKAELTEQKEDGQYQVAVFFLNKSA